MGLVDNKQRSRITLLCAQCKRRKVKCDRKLPCLSCVKHNVPESCSYFGDQVVALALTTNGGVSVFRAFAGEQDTTGKSRDLLLPFAGKIEEHYGTKEDTDRHVSAAKRPHKDPPVAGSERQVMVEELSRLKAKLHHLETSMDRRLPTNGTGANNMPFPPGGIVPPGSYLPPVNSVPGALPPPALPLAQRPPMYTNNGNFPAAPPHLGLSPGPGPGLGPGPGITLPNNGQMVPPPRNFYPGNSPHLNQFNGPQGTSPGGITMGPGFLPYNIPLVPAQNLGQILPPFLMPEHVPANNNGLFSTPTPGPQLRPINIAQTPVFNPPPGIKVQEIPVLENTWIGVNPSDLLDPDEIFDLYSGYNPIFSGPEGRNTNHGPFSYYSYVQKDPLLQKLWEFMRMPATNTEKPMIASLHEPEEDPLQNKDAMLSHKIKVELNKRTISLGLTVFEGEVDLNMHLMDRIKLMLPTQKAVLILVDRFFRSIYAYFPIIDETHFRKQIKRILGCFSQRDEKYTEIRCTKRYDAATLGILLIVLRISYLSALSNQKCQNERALASHGSPKLEEVKYILTNPINIDVVPVARRCLDQYDLYQRANLTVLQCAVLIRLYFSIAPEQGDTADGYESNVFNVMCIQTAYCMGLNRDPTKIHNYSSDPLRDNLNRKLWFFIKFMDLKMSLQFGFPLMIDDSYNDLQPPSLVKGPSNTLDSAEVGICDTIHLLSKLYGQMRSILKSCISIRQPIKVRELTESLSKFEAETQAKLGTLSKLIRSDEYPPDQLYAKVLNTKIYLNIRLFHLSIFFHMILNFEKSKKYDLAFFYLRKFISISCGEILVEVRNIIKKPELFDPESVVPCLILNPPVVFLVHKSNQLNLRMINLLNYMISKMESDGEAHNINLRASTSYKQNYTNILKLAKLLENINKFNNTCLSMLGHRFLYAWRVSKIHSFLLEIVTSKSFGKSQLQAGMDAIPMTPERVKDLLNITETAFAKVKRGCHKDHGAPRASCKQGVTSKEDISVHHKTPTKEFPLEHNPAHQNPYMQNGHGIGGLRGSVITDNLHDHLSDISSNSTLTFDFADLELTNTEEIDSLWQQINNLKNFNKFDNDDNWGDGNADGGEIVDNSGEWYQRIVPNAPQSDGYPPVEVGVPLPVFNNRPI